VPIVHVQTYSTICVVFRSRQGVHYWRVRVNARGDAERYLGIGVGRSLSTMPAGAVRLLSDGSVKNALRTTMTPSGYDVGDVVGMWL
jgi:hypothetical protein